MAEMGWADEMSWSIKTSWVFLLVFSSQGHLLLCMPLDLKSRCFPAFPSWSYLNNVIPSEFDTLIHCSDPILKHNPGSCWGSCLLFFLFSALEVKVWQFYFGINLFNTSCCCSGVFLLIFCQIQTLIYYFKFLNMYLISSVDGTKLQMSAKNTQIFRLKCYTKKTWKIEFQNVEITRLMRNSGAAQFIS